MAPLAPNMMQRCDRSGPRIEKTDPREQVAAVQHGQQQRRGIEDGAAVDHERDESEVVAETAQDRAEAPETRIPPAAGVALVVVDADQRAARRTHHRPGFLPEHPNQSNWELVIRQLGIDRLQSMRERPWTVVVIRMRVLVTGGTGYLGSAIVRGAGVRGPRADRVRAAAPHPDARRRSSATSATRAR